MGLTVPVLLALGVLVAGIVLGIWIAVRVTMDDLWEDR